jgi:hypothetical protein
MDRSGCALVSRQCGISGEVPIYKRDVSEKVLGNVRMYEKENLFCLTCVWE